MKWNMSLVSQMMINPSFTSLQDSEDYENKKTLAFSLKWCLKVFGCFNVFSLASKGAESVVEWAGHTVWTVRHIWACSPANKGSIHGSWIVIFLKHFFFYRETLNVWLDVNIRPEQNSPSKWNPLYFRDEDTHGPLVLFLTSDHWFPSGLQSVETVPSMDCYSSMKLSLWS